MARNIEELEAEIRELSHPDQARLLACLLESMQGPGDAEVDSAWARESVRRMDELHAGKTTARSLNDAVSEIRAGSNA